MTSDDELLALAKSKESEFVRRRRTLVDFRYDEQQEKFWDTTTGNLLGAKSVDGAIHRLDWPVDGDEKAIKPSIAINAIDSGLTVEGSTWWPGKPQFIENVVVSERGAMDLVGAVCYNSYIAPFRPITKPKGSPDIWIDHVKKLYPDPVEHNHFFDFCAHMIQRPDEKVNHGLVMAGAQGIGKDTALLPVRHGVGEWNAAEVGPDAIHGAYNPHVKSVLLVVNEVRPNDEEFKASNFYNLLKPLLAAPPEMLPMTIKYANTIYIRNLCHVVLTTNDPLTMYIPAEDRRLFVMTSALEDPKISNDFPPLYFDKIHSYLQQGGTEAVIWWLSTRSLQTFGITNPPPMTRGKKAIIESAHQVRRSAVDDVFEQYCDHVGGKPDAFFQKDLLIFVNESDYFDDSSKIVNMINAKNFHFKMAERGYDLIRCPYKSEWKKGKFRSRAGFAKRQLLPDDQISALEKELNER
jgi:hypothetical protein